MRKPACIMGLLLAALCGMAQTADAESKGEALPERTVELVVDVDNRFIEDEFGGDANSEDGYVPGTDNTALNCAPHTSDFDPQDWVIILSELLQLIQLYNANGYQPCEAPEAFCPVLL